VDDTVGDAVQEALKPDTAEDLAGWLADGCTRLAKVRFGPRRYVAKDVDAFITEVKARLGRGELPEPAWVRTAKFQTTTDHRGGYELRPVDELLAELQARLRVALGGKALEPDVIERIMRVEHAQFKRSWNGYDYLEVDTFLDQVIDALSEGGEPVTAPAFAVRRRGYDRQDVDAFVQEEGFTAEAAAPEPPPE
jgi:DivIVA domain-containing protein